jgi:hypothetical protein
MDRRALENFVQDVIDSGTNPLTHPELAVHLREHPDLARQAEELWRVDQWMRLCGDADGSVDPAECDGLLDAVMSAVETTPQQTVEPKPADNWILRVGLPAAAAATLTLGSFSGVAAAKPTAVPALSANPFSGSSFSGSSFSGSSFSGSSFSGPDGVRLPAGYPVLAPATAARGTAARGTADRPYPGAGRPSACPPAGAGLPACERSGVRRPPDRPSASQRSSARLRTPAPARFASAAS